MADIPFADLKVGDRVVATLTGGDTAIVRGMTFTGAIAEIKRYPPVRGRTQVIVWLDRKGGTAHDIGINHTVGGEEPPEWTFTEDPAFTEYKKKSRGLAEVSAFKQQVPEDVINYKLAPLLGLKTTAKKAGRRRKTRRGKKSVARTL
jgi:hypothetical protein